MINKLMIEINEKIEKLNKLLENEKYFKDLEIVIDRQNKYNQKLAKKLEQKDNIIKEVREYIEEAQERDEDKESCSLYIPKLLEILDKDSDKEWLKKN